MRVAVVGVGGVGMAHVCACVRQGQDVVAMVDVDQDTLDRVATKWENRWLDVCESVPRNSACLYVSSVFNVPGSLVDLWIVATPPLTHPQIVRYILGHSPQARIMVEKPLSVYADEGEFDRQEEALISMSAEWVYHAELESVDWTRVASLGMRFPESHTTSWSLAPMLDFGPHLLSVLHSRGFDLDRIMPIEIESDRFYCVAIGRDSRRVALWGNRRPGAYGLFIDEARLDWQSDLFDRQVVRGGLPFSVAVYHERKLLQCLLPSAS